MLNFLQVLGLVLNIIVLFFTDKVSLSGSNIPSPVPGEFENSIHTPSNDSGVIESQGKCLAFCI